jgi:hypothetical protein
LYYLTWHCEEKAAPRALGTLAVFAQGVKAAERAETVAYDRRLLRQYLYFCASKVSKMSKLRVLCLRRELRLPHVQEPLATVYTLVKHVSS